MILYSVNNYHNSCLQFVSHILCQNNRFDFTVFIHLLLNVAGVVIKGYSLSWGSSPTWGSLWGNTAPFHCSIRRILPGDAYFNSFFMMGGAASIPVAFSAVLSHFSSKPLTETRKSPVLVTKYASPEQNRCGLHWAAIKHSKTVILYGNRCLIVS